MFLSAKSDTRAPEVHINASLFAENKDNPPDIYTVVLHEIGHVLGLSHSADIRSIMYPIYRVGGSIVAEELASQLLVSRFVIPGKGQQALVLPQIIGNIPKARTAR